MNKQAVELIENNFNEIVKRLQLLATSLSFILMFRPEEIIQDDKQDYQPPAGNLDIMPVIINGIDVMLYIESTFLGQTDLLKTYKEQITKIYINIERLLNSDIDKEHKITYLMELLEVQYKLTVWIIDMMEKTHESASTLFLNIDTN